MKMFNEVSSLLGSPLDIRESEEHTRETEPEKLGLGIPGYALRFSRYLVVTQVNY
jgi:hypothetical protein